MGEAGLPQLLLFLFAQIPRQERDAPTVEDWKTFGRRGRAGQETTARTSFPMNSRVLFGSPSHWDVTTVERLVQGSGESWCGWRELLRSTDDEQGLRLSHRRAVSFQSEKRGVQAARNGPSEDRKCWQRVELGIHGLNRWLVKCIEMSRKRRVPTDKREQTALRPATRRFRRQGSVECNGKGS